MRHRATRRARLAARAAALALGVLAGLAPAVAAPPATAATTSGVTVRLASVTPPIATPGAAVTVAGTVVNTSGVPVGSPVVRATLSDQPLTTRAAVTAWAAGGRPDQDAPEVAHQALRATLAAGQTARFSLRIAARDIANDSDFAALPLRLDVEGSSATGTADTAEVGSLNTFLPWRAGIKRYEPLSIAWLVPLTLDPRPALFGPSSPARTAAWTAAIGPGSRVDRIMGATGTAPVTWAVDPALLGPPAATMPGAGGTTTAPPPTPTPPATTPGGTGTPAPDPVTALTTALAARLRTAARRHTVWSLPYADPDLSATLRAAPHDPVVSALLARPNTLQQQLGAPARADIAWPAQGGLSRGDENQLRELYSAAGLTAAVVPGSTLARTGGYTGNAARKSSDGLPLLAYDDGLSRLFARTGPADGAVTVQEFLAQTLAMLAERPGTPRTVLVAAPRGFAPDPATLRHLFAAVRSAPWLSPTTTTDLLHRAVDATPERGNAPAGAAPAGPNPFDLGRTPLSAAGLAAVDARRSEVQGVASVLDNGAAFERAWLDAVDQLTSTRWRSHTGGWRELDTTVGAATHQKASGIRVLPSTVNFLADQGILKVTIVNELGVAVHDVHLRLVPGSQRLRVEDEAPPLRIGGHSRTTVPLHVTAIAAGLVPIDAELTTPNGTPLGERAQVTVRVQPTGVWVYWVLGGIAGAVLLLGLARTRRRTRSRVPAPARENAAL